jgi:hypothetical protein
VVVAQEHQHQPVNHSALLFLDIKIFMKKFFITLALVLGCIPLTYSTASEPTCTVVAGAITDTTTCKTQADNLTVKIYEIGLCTVQPTAPTPSTAADLSSCQKIFSSSNGSQVTITGTTSSGFTGTFTRPTNGTYTYGYLALGPDHGVQASLKFASAKTVAGGTSTGSYCWTKNGSMWRLDMNTSAFVECGNFVGGSVGLATSSYNSFDGSGGVFVNTDNPATGTNRYLVGDDFMLKLQPSTATSYGDITKQLISVALSPSIVVTDATTSVDVGFQSSRSAKIKFDNFGNILFIKNGELGMRLVVN